MKNMFSRVVLSLTGGVLLAGTAFAADGILYKAQAPGTNYCHLKFPAIDRRTLHWDRPVLEPSGTSDTIDFYGPCNTDPTGREQAWDQHVRNIRRQNMESK